MPIDTLIVYVGVYGGVADAEADYQLAGTTGGRGDPRRRGGTCGGGHEPPRPRGAR